jgi:hypothetical protein
MIWKAYCYTSTDPNDVDSSFQVSSFAYYGDGDFKKVWWDIESTLGRKQSGIVKVVLACDSGRTWELTSMNDAKEKLGKFLVFS